MTSATYDSTGRRRRRPSTRAILHRQGRALLRVSLFLDDRPQATFADVTAFCKRRHYWTWLLSPGYRERLRALYDLYQAPMPSWARDNILLGPDGWLLYGSTLALPIIPAADPDGGRKDSSGQIGSFLGELPRTASGNSPEPCQNLVKVSGYPYM